MGLHIINPEVVSKDALLERISRYEQVIIEAFKRIGEEAVKIARRTHKYKDLTGNLTSSIGYGVAVNGKIIAQSNFALVKKGQQGVKGGQSFLLQLCLQDASGIVLYIVAGMEYAKYVEAKGLNVLAQAQLTTKAMLKKVENLKI